MARWRRRQQTTAQLTWDINLGLYVLQCEIDWDDEVQKNLAALIKAKVPAGERSYQPVTKTWYFHEKWFDYIKGIIDAGWHENSFIYTKEQAEEVNRNNQNAESSSYQQRVHSTDKYITTFVNLLMKHSVVDSAFKFEEHDLPAITKLYRRASLILHPDRNPAGAIDMATLNEAWSYIKAAKENTNNG